MTAKRPHVADRTKFDGSDYKIRGKSARKKAAKKWRIRLERRIGDALATNGETK